MKAWIIALFSFMSYLIVSQYIMSLTIHSAVSDPPSSSYHLAISSLTPHT